MSCIGFKELMVWQEARMRHCLEEAKWFLSEIAGRDVGPHAAAEDFRVRHLDQCAVDWRKDYCGSLCDYRHACALGAAMIRKDEGKHE